MDTRSEGEQARAEHNPTTNVNDTRSGVPDTILHTCDWDSATPLLFSAACSAVAV